MLRDEGRRVAQQFLDEHGHDIGVRSTVDLDVLLQEVLVMMGLLGVLLGLALLVALAFRGLERPASGTACRLDSQITQRAKWVRAAPDTTGARLCFPERIRRPVPHPAVATGKL